MVKKISEKPKQEVKKSTEDISFNFDMNMLKKLIPVFLILIVMFFAFYVRSGPSDLRGLEDRVEENVYSQIRGVISQQVSAQYPNLDSQYRDEMVAREYQKVLDTGEYELQGQKIVIADIAKQNSEAVKQSFKADNGQTYLNAIDPYFFYRKSENVLQTGTTGDIVIDGVGYESKQLAPNMRPSGNPEFHVWLEAKLFNLFGVEADADVGEKTRVIFWIPVIISMLAVIPIYLIIRRFSNDLFALFGSLILVSVGTFVSRTVAGFVDTDAYNVFFPLVIALFAILAFVYKNRILTIILALLAGLFQGLFIWAWSPGWFIFTFLVISLLGYIGYIVLSNITKIGGIKDFSDLILNDILVVISFVLSSYIFTWLIKGSDIFVTAYRGISGSISGLAIISGTNIWPNVFSSVAELNPASFSQIINSIGGKFVFLIAILGLVFMMLDFIDENKKRNLVKRILYIFTFIWTMFFVNSNMFISLSANSKELFVSLLFLPVAIALIISLIAGNKGNKIFTSILLTVWIAGTVFMSLIGVRFILLLAPATSIAFGIGLFYLSKIVNVFFTEEFKLKGYFQNVYGFAAASILFVMLFMPLATNALLISDNSIPNFDDAWYQSMYNIKDSSAEDAIITSWWDFGHFFAAIAERGVTFDGASQTTPQSHWVGKLLLENDEATSHDILKMLVCGGNNAFDYILDVSKDNTQGVKTNKLLYSTFGKSNEEKIELLSDYKYYNFTDEQIDEVMNKLACSNPLENFVITSEDMVGKAGVWAHWGSWDFTKKYVHDNYNSMTSEKIAIELDEDINLVNQYVEELKAIDSRAQIENIKREDLINYWFAAYPTYRGTGSCIEKDEGIYCGIGFNANGNVFATSYQGFDDCRRDESENIFCSFKVEGDSVDLLDVPMPNAFKSLIIPYADRTLGTIELNESGVFDIVLTQTNGGYNYMLVDAPLGGSLFTKLFYLDGVGTTMFDKFDDQQSTTGIRIITWKTLWDKKEDTLKVSDISFELGNVTSE